MYILLPCDSKDPKNANITKIQDVVVWTQLLIDEGKVAEVNHSESWEDFENFSEAVIVCDDSEYVWPFMEYNMMVLVAHTQKSLDDVVEAFLFKELHDLAY